MLSDACFDLIQLIWDISTGEIRDFIESLDNYSTPPYDYPSEDIQALRDAAERAMAPDAAQELFIQLLILADSTRRKYDTPPL